MYFIICVIPLVLVPVPYIHFDSYSVNISLADTRTNDI